MPDASDAQVRYPISNYPIGTIISHHSVPGIKWKVIKHHGAVEGGTITKVDIQKHGGELNRGVITLDADNDAYVAIGGRLRGRMRQRAMQQRAAAIPPEEAETATTIQGKPEIKPITRPSSRSVRRPKDTAKSAAQSGPKSKGKHSRGKPTVPVIDLELDPRNPFYHGSRIHAYFQAILNGRGRATYGQMVSCCLELGERFGIEDTESAIRRDLNNQNKQWCNGKWGLRVTKDDSRSQKGKGGRLAKGEHDNVMFTCLEVKKHPWDEHLDNHRE